MIPFEKASQIVLEHASSLETGTEKINLLLATGRVLAEDVYSDMDFPPFNKSAMDGYACRKEDLPGPLRIIETIPAGSVPSNKIEKGTCAKIMTGAIVPEGADTVIMIEYTTNENDDTVRFTATDTRPNIAFKGEDLKKGDLILRSGTLVGPEHVAVLASAGCDKPTVVSKPRIGIIATGDELVEPHENPRLSQIRNSNSYQLFTQCSRINTHPYYYGIARDRKDEIISLIRKAKEENDIILLSGGVSMGDFDLVPDAIKECGFEILFDKVAIKPGKPSTFAVSDDCICFGMPGNPVSTFVIFEILVAPFIRKAMNATYRQPYFPMELESDFRRKKAEREEFIPVNFTEKGKAKTLSYHGSGHFHALTIADGLMRVPARTSELSKGTVVDVRPL